MFPYADKADTFWSGYFSSRALSKRNIRAASQMLAVSGQVYALAGLDNTLFIEEAKKDAAQKERDGFAKWMDALGVN